jgi:hypothetical protein
MTSDPSGHVKFNFNEPSLVSRYRFGQHTADFLVCGRCGGYAGSVTLFEGMTLAVVNINLIQPQPAQLGDAQPMNYDGETVEVRSGRRAQRWTPCTAL